MLDADFWSLPSCRRGFEKIASFASSGYGRVDPPHYRRESFAEAVRDYLEERSWQTVLADTSFTDPIAAVASPLGARLLLEGLVDPVFDGTVILVELPKDGSALRGWEVFLQRFMRSRLKDGSGLSIIMFGKSDSSLAPHDAANFWNWSNEFRRVDAQVWTDLHMPVESPDIYHALASSIAGNLLGWRFDLITKFALCRINDLFDPIGWLRRRDELASSNSRGFNGSPFECPLFLLHQGLIERLRSRLWRAQIAALFPWLEDQRQRFLERYRENLRVNAQLVSIGVKDIDQIELGAMHYQLRNKLRSHERDHLERLARIRNALAHRQPAEATDLQLALLPSKL